MYPKGLAKGQQASPHEFMLDTGYLGALNPADVFPNRWCFQVALPALKADTLAMTAVAILASPETASRSCQEQGSLCFSFNGIVYRVASLSYDPSPSLWIPFYRQRHVHD